LIGINARRRTAIDATCLRTEADMIARILGWRRKRPECVLLPRRMAALEVDAGAVERIEPAAFRDLQSICANCDAAGQCGWDLVHNPGNPAWQDYCPNAAILSALSALGMFGPATRPWPAGLERPPRRPPF
jgi:hypothetical protein